MRERGFSRFGAETQCIFKVVGVADLLLWKWDRRVFSEIAPTSIKKLITGSGKSNKTKVAASLEKYVGKQEYACDDESDAVAVGVAWLIENGHLP